MPGDWDEDAHPRDEQGRFGGGGGSGGGSKAVEKWMGKGSSPGGPGGPGGSQGAPKSSGDASPTRSLPAPGNPKTGQDNVKLTPDRVWTDKRPAGMAPQTYMDHFQGRPGTKDEPLKNMKPTEERKTRVHDPIVKEALNVPLPAPGAQKIAIMTMGGPASGKGTVLREMGASTGKGGKMVLVDPDHVKGQMPEYKKALDPKNTFRGAAAMAHEESSFISKRIRDEAISRGNHVVIDGTGTNAKKFLATMDNLKSNGYEVHVHYPHLDEATGLGRAKARAEGSGRYVPDEFVSTSYKGIDKNVEHIMSKADNFHMYDAKNGHTPIYSKVGGKETVHNETAMAAFKGRKKQ